MRRGFEIPHRRNVGFFAFIFVCSDFVVGASIGVPHGLRVPVP